jgi:hypothetical protein
MTSRGRAGQRMDMYLPDQNKPKKAKKIWTKEEILEIWPQADAELQGFRRALQAKSGITAAQLDMALQLADAEYKRLKKEGAE